MSRIVDFSHVPLQQDEMHKRLENWANANFSGVGGSCSPMFRLYRSGDHWHSREPTIPVDHHDAMRVAKGVVALPDPHRLAIDWFYISKGSPMAARRRIGCTAEALHRYVIDGRTMLINRDV